VTEKVDNLAKKLWDDGLITFDEWIVITYAVTNIKLDSCLPDRYEAARQALTAQVD
jgi:hypothetical protein